MSKPYEKLISFCKAEIIAGKTYWVEVTEQQDYYKILFIGLRHSVDIYKPHKADAYDLEAVAMYGHIHLPYREDPLFPDLCGMLGLNSPWVKTQGAAEEPDHEEWVLIKWCGEYSVYQYDKVNGRWIDQEGDEVHPPTEWMRINP